MRKGTRQCRTFPALLLAVAGATGGNDTLAAQDGLVLSGGGSRGLAHAGAIVGLERLGLRPDLVVGTSMGAVIGGLYASGMAPDSIWALTQSQDWQAMFAPSAVRPGPDGEPRRPLTRLGLFVDRARYVDGLIADWQVNRELVRLFLDASFRARGDFDALPRRFRSVAADLRTGRAVVLSSGDLARSIRASMSVPGVFAPVVMDGVPLVDGGLADYLPVGPARRAGAARVIAVDVIRPPPDEVGLNPFQSALRAFRMTLYNARQERDSADISITPVIDPDLFAAVFMRDPEPLLEAGLRAALELSDTFDNGRTVLSLRAAPVSFAALRVESNDSALLSLIRRTFEPVASRRYDRTSILDATDDLYASGLFSGVWPRVESDGAADTLVVFAEAFAPTTITSAAGYDTDRGFRGWATLTRRIGGRLEGSLGVSVGEIETWGLALLRLRPLNAMPAVSLEMGASIEANDVRLFDGDDPAGEVQITRAGGRLGTTWHALEPNVEVEALVSFEHIDREFAGDYAWGPEFRVTMPGPNAMIVGTPLRVEAVWRFGDVEYRRFRAAGSAGVHTGEFQAALVGDITVARGGAPIDEWPALGDARAVPGLRWGRLRAPSLAVAGLDFAVATPLESHTRLRLRAGTIASEPGDLGSNGWYTGAGLGILWWTPLGRLAFEAGVARGGDWLLWLDVGPIF